MQATQSSTTEMQHVNYESDFRVVFSFPENKVPDYPWEIELSTPNTPAYNAFVASFDGENYHNCSMQSGKELLVAVDNHKLQPGILSYKFKIKAPDAAFPDGVMNVTTPGQLGIELWTGPSDEFEHEGMNVIVLPLEGDKGEPGEPGAPGEPGKSAYELFKDFNPDSELTEEQYAEAPIVEADRAAALADNPPKIVEVDGMAYWAFYDLETQQYMTSKYRADDGTIVQQVDGADVSLDVVGGTMYVCGELTSLTIASVENSTKPSIIRFTSGATATQFSFPENFSITGWTKPEGNNGYTICILFGAGNMTYDE